MELRAVILPVGRVEPAEIEAVGDALAKVFHHEVAPRAAVAVPKAGDDPVAGSTWPRPSWPRCAPRFRRRRPPPGRPRRRPSWPSS